MNENWSIRNINDCEGRKIKARNFTQILAFLPPHSHYLSHLAMTFKRHPQ